MLGIRLFSLITLVMALSSPNVTWAKRKYGALESHDGYVASVEEEKDKKYVELIFGPQSEPSLPKNEWAKKIFNDEELSREFKEKYERQFGRTEAEQAQNFPNPYVVVNVVNDQGVLYRGTVTENQTLRQQFGEYMIRRMVEHNVDKFVKSEPAIRPLYEIKDRISHADVAVAPGYSLAMNYSLSANNFRLRLVNPYVHSEVILEMNPTAFGPANVLETTYALGRQFTSTINIFTYLKVTDGVISVVGRKNFKPTISATLTIQANTHDHGSSQRDTLYLAGLTWQY